MKENQFENRIAFCVWINDIRNEPIIDSWPSVIIDKRILDDYKEMMVLLKRAGYNAFDIFGLLTNHNWPLDIKSVITSERKHLVEDMIKTAHNNDIKIIYGLGVYSWGFDKIINEDPEVRGTNPSAMCGSKPKAKEWQERVIDFVIDNFDIDGFHLEVADQGRCKCPDCAKENNVQYYSRINSQTAQYIKEKSPDSLLLVNTCGYMPWGDFVKEEDFKYLYEMGKHIDVFIDGGNHGLFIREEDRKKFIPEFECDYGTSGGFWIYPPQRWDRLRWFIPHMNRNAEHLKKLNNDGGRTCELYMGPAVNPGTEANIFFNGLLLSDLERDNKDILTEVVGSLYKPKSSGDLGDLVEIFTRAEDVFFNNWSQDRLTGIPKEYSDGLDDIFEWSKKTSERAFPGELMLEPIQGNIPGPPVYLVIHMTPEGRMGYKNELKDILNDLNKLGNGFDDAGRLNRIKVCIENTIKDIDSI